MRGSHLVATLASLTLACSPSTTRPESTPDASSISPTDADAADAPSADASETRDAHDDAGAGAPAPRTRALLDEFWADHGGRGAFSQLQLDAVEAMLLAEDDVLAGRYAQARARVDAVFSAYPKSDPAWWSTPVPQGLNLGTPVAYYGLRMIDDIARVGAAEGVEPLGSLQLTVVRVACAVGRRPATADLSEGEDVSLTLDPALEDRAIIDASFSLFGAYARAITGGRLTLDVEVVDVQECAAVTFDPDSRVSSIEDAAASVRLVPEEVRRATDMWLVTYPSNVPPGPEFEGAEFITGGMGAFGDAPLFIADDLWIVRKPPHLGDGPYTEVERRVYLPQWVQHEFFHHLFRRYPDFGLEARGHQWFDRDTWPDDFVGQWEPDYYAEALNKRLASATPPLHDALRVAPRHVDTSRFTRDDLAGDYARLPVENGYHEVTVSRSGDGLTWTNAAGVSWSMTWEDGALRTGEDCPYGAQEVPLRVRFGQGDDLTLEGLVFLGELYAARP